MQTEVGLGVGMCKGSGQWQQEVGFYVDNWLCNFRQNKALASSKRLEIIFYLFISRQFY